MKPSIFLVYTFLLIALIGGIFRFCLPTSADSIVSISLESVTKTTSSGQIQNITIGQSITTLTIQKIYFSGQCNPNDLVNVVIRPTHVTKSITSDIDGQWQFELNPKSLNLSAGKYQINAYAVNSNGLKSDEIKLGDIILKNITQNDENLPSEDTSSYLSSSFFVPINYILLGILAMIIGLYLVIKMIRTSNS